MKHDIQKRHTEVTSKLRPVLVVPKFWVCCLALSIFYTITCFSAELVQGDSNHKHDVTINPLAGSILLDPNDFEITLIQQVDDLGGPGAIVSTIRYHDVGDLDGNGDPDIVISGWTVPQNAVPELPIESDIHVFEAQPNATIMKDAESILGTSKSNGTSTLRLADFDNDGQQDLLMMSFNEYPFASLPGSLFTHKNGAFSQSSISPQAGVHEGSVVDFNNDGYLDFIGSAYRTELDLSEFPLGENSQSKGSLLLYENDQSGGFKSWIVHANKSLESGDNGNFFSDGGVFIHRGSASTAGNIDQDPELEIIVVDSPNSSEVESLIIDDIKFETFFAYGEVRLLPDAYFDRDSRFDDNKFIKAGGQDKSHDVEVTLFDIDRDSDLDLLISAHIWTTNADASESAGILQILENDGEGNFEDITNNALFNFNIAGNSTHDIRIIDINGDGLEDIIMPENSYNENVPKQFVKGELPLYRSVDQTWSNRILINAGNGKFVEVFKNGFHELTLMQEQTLISLGSEIEPYSLIDQRYFPYLLADGRLGFVTFQTAYPSQLIYFDVRAKEKLSTGPGGVDPAPMSAPGFSEYFYLTEYPDVALQVASGLYENGLAHFLAEGRSSGRFAFAEGVIVHGGGGDDVVVLRGGNEISFGYAGDDSFVTGPGDDTIDGGPGIDIVSYPLGRESYVATAQGNEISITNLGNNEIDRISNVELFEFEGVQLTLEEVIGGINGSQSSDAGIPTIVANHLRIPNLNVNGVWYNVLFSITEDNGSTLLTLIEASETSSVISNLLPTFVGSNLIIPKLQVGDVTYFGNFTLSNQNPVQFVLSSAGVFQ